MRLNNDNDDLNAAGYEYILIGDDRSVEVIDMFRDHYLPDETASRAIGLTLNDELKDIILAQVYFIYLNRTICCSREVQNGTVYALFKGLNHNFEVVSSEEKILAQTNNREVNVI